MTRKLRATITVVMGLCIANPEIFIYAFRSGRDWCLCCPTAHCVILSRRLDSPWENATQADATDLVRISLLHSPERFLRIIARTIPRRRRASVSGSDTLIRSRTTRSVIRLLE